MRDSKRPLIGGKWITLQEFSRNSSGVDLDDLIGHACDRVPARIAMDRYTVVKAACVFAGP